VAHFYNPSYSRGRDWEDHDSRPVWAKSSQDPISTNKSWVWWHTPVVLAMQEVYIGGYWSRLAQA
jgi:hypothetical protein